MAWAAAPHPNPAETESQAHSDKEVNAMGNTFMERMREIEIFGVPALFTEKAIPPEAVYPGIFRYELLAGDDGRPRYAVNAASGRRLGTVLTPVPIFRYPTDTQREFGPGDLVLDTGAGCCTPAEFEEKYLSPNCGSAAREERYGKETWYHPVSESRFGGKRLTTGPLL